MNIIIADDHALFREGLRSLLEKDKELIIVGEASNGRDAVEMTLQKKPDVVIMDLSMEELNGIEATRLILRDVESVKILIISMHSDRQSILQAIHAGARGYLLKESTFEELGIAIKSLRLGHFYLSPRISDHVIREMIAQGSATPSNAVSELTTREREVVKLIADGNTSKEIATKLYISVKTVETHRYNIMNKLGLRTISDLTKYALREGMTSIS